jgi:hypothetical protein
VGVLKIKQDKGIRGNKGCINNFLHDKGWCVSICESKKVFDGLGHVGINNSVLQVVTKQSTFISRQFRRHDDQCIC